MTIRNTYIKVENKKAYNFLINNGFTLTKGVKDYYIYNGFENILVASTNVYWVNWGGSGSSFHRYLVDNGLTR
jgi:hypothetical protein